MLGDLVKHRLRALIWIPSEIDVKAFLRHVESIPSDNEAKSSFLEVYALYEIFNFFIAGINSPFEGVIVVISRVGCVQFLENSVKGFITLLVIGTVRLDQADVSESEVCAVLETKVALQLRLLVNPKAFIFRSR